MITYRILLLAHVLSAVGTFGVLLAVQCGLPAEVRRGTAAVKGCIRCANLLLAVAFAAGLALFLMYYLSGGPTVHAKVGSKIVLLLVAGGALAMAGAAARKSAHGRADALRWLATGCLAGAALLGITI